MGVSEGQINNIMGGMEQTAGVRLHNHRHKLKQRFDIVKKLGQGTYGKVQLAINKETGQEVAIKTIKKAKIETEQDLVRIRREIQIMSSVTHPHIIHIFEVFENREKMVLVMEYAAGGELYDYLSERKVLSENEARRVFRQVATACFYCHKHKICHRDLKLENILLDEYGNAKIADFGLSNVFDERRQLATFCGSPLYASPEIVRGTPYVGPEVDCWSLGVLLYTLVYGAMPFDGSNFKKLVKQITTGDYYEPKKRSPASELIGGLLTVSAERRSTIENICSHWWVNKGSDSCCLRVAEELASQTPVRLDLLLSLAPQGRDKEHMLTPGDAEMAEAPVRSPSRTPSKGSRTDADAFSASRSRSLGSLMEVEPAGAQAPSPPRPPPPAPAAMEPAAKRSLEEDGYIEPAPSKKKDADREERRARKKDGERTLKRKKKRAESAARETPVEPAESASAARPEERVPPAEYRVSEAAVASRSASRGPTPESTRSGGTAAAAALGGSRSPATDRRKSPSSGAAATPATARRSPADTSTSARSPVHSPAAPRSPALTPKPARSPEPIPKPQQVASAAETSHHPAQQSPVASHRTTAQPAAALHSPVTVISTSACSPEPEPEPKQLRTPEPAAESVRSPERIRSASRSPAPAPTEVRTPQPPPATGRSPEPPPVTPRSPAPPPVTPRSPALSPAPVSPPAAPSAPVSPPAPASAPTPTTASAPQAAVSAVAPPAEMSPVPVTVLPSRPLSPAQTAAPVPREVTPQTVTEPVAVRPRSPAPVPVSSPPPPPPPEVLVQQASGDPVTAAAKEQASAGAEVSVTSGIAGEAAVTDVQMLDAPQEDQESRRESADSACSKASHNGDGLGRRNSKIYKAAAMWDNMIAPPEPAVKTLERPKRIIRDSLKLEPKPKPEPKPEEKKKPVLGLFSGIKVMDAKKAFESKPKEVLKPVPLRKKGSQAKSVILQDAGGPIPMKDMTGRVYSSKSSGTVLKEAVGKVKKTKAKENGVGSGKTDTNESSCPSAEKEKLAGRKDKSPEKKEKSPETRGKLSIKSKDNAHEKTEKVTKSGDSTAKSDAEAAPKAAPEKKVIKKKKKDRPASVACTSSAELTPCSVAQPCPEPQSTATAQVAAQIGEMVSAIREVGEAISKEENEIKQNEADIVKKLTEPIADQGVQADSQRAKVSSESGKRLAEATTATSKQPGVAAKGRGPTQTTSLENKYSNTAVQQSPGEQNHPEQKTGEVPSDRQQPASRESGQPITTSQEETSAKQPASPEQGNESKPKIKAKPAKPKLVIPQREVAAAAPAATEPTTMAAPQTAPAVPGRSTAAPSPVPPAALTPRESESQDTLNKIFRHAESKDSLGTENRFIKDVAARRRSDADQRTKYATLPAKKKTELRVVLGQEPRPADGGQQPALGRRPSDVRSELEAPVNSPSSTQRTEVTFSVAAPDRAHSLPPQRAKSREHIIHISMDGRGAEQAAEPAAAAAPPVPTESPAPRPARNVRHAASLQSLPERQRPPSDDDMRQAVLRSLPRARSQLSSPAAAGISSPPPSGVTSPPPPPVEPIRKSRREFIIPIALEGGGTVTPPVRAASEEAERAQGAGLFRSQRLSGSGHRRMGLAPRPRSGFSVERSESFSSAGEDEEEDEDQFEILTAESLFTTLLDRVRNLTRRVSTEDSPLKRTMMLANQPAGSVQQQQQQQQEQEQQQPGIWGMPSPMRSLFDQPLGFPHTSLFDQPPAFSRQSSSLSQREGSVGPQQPQPTWRRTKSREDAAFSTLPKNFRRRGQCFETDEDPANYTRSLPRRYTARAPSKDLPSIDDDEPAEQPRPGPQPFVRQQSQPPRTQPPPPSPSPSPMSPEPQLTRPRKFLAYKKSSTADSPLGGSDAGSSAERAGSARDFISRFLRQDPALGRSAPAPAAAAPPEPEPGPAPAYRVYTRTSSREYPPAEQTAAGAAAGAAGEPPKVAWRPRSLHSTFRPPGEANGRDGGRSAVSQEPESASGPPARRRSLIDAPPGERDANQEPEPEPPEQPTGRPRPTADEVRRSLGRALSMRLGEGRKESGVAPRARSYSRGGSRSPERPAGATLEPPAGEDSERTPVPSPETRRTTDRTVRPTPRGDVRPASAGYYADSADGVFSPRSEYRSEYLSSPLDGYRAGSRPRSPRSDELRLGVEPYGRGGRSEYRQSASPSPLSPTETLYSPDTYRFSSPFTRSSERSVQNVLKDIRQKRESVVSPPPVPEADPELESELSGGLRAQPQKLHQQQQIQQQHPVQQSSVPGVEAVPPVGDSETWQDAQESQTEAVTADPRPAGDAPKKPDKQTERSVFDEISRKTAKLLNLDRGKDEEAKGWSDKRPGADDQKEKKSSLTQKLSRIPSLIRRAGSRSEMKDEDGGQERDRLRPAESAAPSSGPESQPPTPVNPDLPRGTFNHYADQEEAPPGSLSGGRPGSRRQSLDEPEERPARDARRSSGVRSAVSRLQQGEQTEPPTAGRSTAGPTVIVSGEHQLQNGPVANGGAEQPLNGCPELPEAERLGGYPENGGESELRRRRRGRRLSVDTDPASENTDTSELNAADDDEDSVSDRILRKSYFPRFNDRRRDRSASREVLSLIYDEPSAEPPRRAGRRERESAGRSSSLRSSSRDPSEAADSARFSSSTLPRRRKLGSAGCLPSGDDADPADSREMLSSSNVSLRSSRESLPSDSGEPRPSRLSSIEEGGRRPGRGSGDAPYFRPSAAPSTSTAEYYRRHTSALGPAIASSRLSSIGDQLKRDLDSVTSNIESLKEARKSRSAGTASQPQLRRYSRYGSGGAGSSLGGGGGATGGGGLSFSSSSWRYL